MPTKTKEKNPFIDILQSLALATEDKYCIKGDDFNLINLSKKKKGELESSMRNLNSLLSYCKLQNLRILKPTMVSLPGITEVKDHRMLHPNFKYT